jgi:hypothetical protein
MCPRISCIAKKDLQRNTVAVIFILNLKHGPRWLLLLRQASWKHMLVCPLLLG